MILNICQNSGFLSVFRWLKYVIDFFGIIVPLLLIVSLGYDLFKLVIAKDPKYENKINVMIKKGIAAVCLFFIPLLVNVILSFVNGSNIFENECWKNANIETINYYKNKEKEEKEKEEKEKAKEQEKAEKERKEREEKREEARKKNEEEARKAKEEKEKQHIVVNNNGLSSTEFLSKLNSMSTPTLSELEKAAQLNGITSDYLKIIIGTTANEEYPNDLYLYYGWASAMINYPKSIEDMQVWDPYNSGEANYYSRTNVMKGYNSANDIVLKSVYLALTERNRKIIECNGMYIVNNEPTPSTYNRIYNSTVYTCAIYEVK